MAKFGKLIPGFVTDLNPKGLHLIGKNRYDFSQITATQCEEIMATGCKHIKKAKKVIKP
jgi:hypothetical protein